MEKFFFAPLQMFSEENKFSSTKCNFGMRTESNFKIDGTRKVFCVKENSVKGCQLFYGAFARR